jgi:hypothetical protein
MARIVEAAGRWAGFDNVGDDLRRRLTGRQSLFISSIVEDYRTKVEAAYRETAPPLVRAPQGAPPSVTVKVVPSERADFVVYVENLRNDAAVEALMLGYTRPDQGGRLQPLQGYDACSFDRASDSRPGPSGRILPQKMRRIDLSLTSPYAGSRIDAAMVLFDDLSFEGAAELRDRTLAQRARLAEDYGFWAVAYRQAMAAPRGQVRQLLERQRSQRQQQKAALGAGPDVGLGSEAIGMFDRSPQAFPEWAARRARELEEACARLTRHLRK